MNHPQVSIIISNQDGDLVNNMMDWKVSEGDSHSSTLVWKIPWMEEPGRLQSMGLGRVGHNWASLSLFTFMHWKRKWQSTLVFFPGESQGRWSLVVCCLWACRVGHDLSVLAAASVAAEGHRGPMGRGVAWGRMRGDHVIPVHVV